MSDFSLTDFQQLVTDSDEMALRILSLSVMNLYRLMRDDPTLRLRAVDIQAINAFRRIAKEAFEANLAKRDDGPEIAAETLEAFGVENNEELVTALDQMAERAREKVNEQREARLAPMVKAAPKIPLSG